MKAGHWKGGGDDKRFGDKGRHWFARRVRVLLQGVRYQKRYQMTDDELDAIASRFIAESERYVSWNDSEEYHGRRYSNGAWTLNWEKMSAEVPDLLTEIRSDAARSTIQSLDDWLTADLDDTLGYAVTGGSSRLPENVRQSLLETARTRRRNWPLSCIGCGATFYRFPKQKGKPIRCPDCLRRRKEGGKSARQR